MRKRGFFKSKSIKMKIAKRLRVFILLFAGLIVLVGISGAFLYYQGRFSSSADVVIGPLTISDIQYSPSPPLVNNIISFTPVASAPDPTTVKYAWNFGDNITSTQPLPNHIYAQEGAYNVQLQLTDGSNIISKTINVSIGNEVVYSENFENSNYIVSKFPDSGWNASPAEMKTFSTIVNDAQEGTKAIKIDGTQLDSTKSLARHVITRTTLPLKLGQYYQLTYWAKASHNEYVLRARIDVNANMGVNFIDTEWKQYSTNFSINLSRSHYLVFEINRDEMSPEPGTMWIDNITIKTLTNANSKSTSENYFHNSDFSLGLDERSFDKSRLVPYTRTEPIGNEVAPISNQAAEWPAGSQYATGWMLGRFVAVDLPDTYTFSGYFKGSSSGWLDFRVKDNFNKSFSVYNMTPHSNVGSSACNISTTWQRCSFSIDLTRSDASGGTQWSNIFSITSYYKSGTGQNVYIDNLQVERGKTASAYQPNPELDINFTTNKYHNTFYPNQSVDFSVHTGNFTNNNFSGTSEVTFKDYAGNTVFTKIDPITLNSSETKSFDYTIPAPTNRKDIFIGNLSLKDASGKIVAEYYNSIARIKQFDAADYTDPDPYFGIHDDAILPGWGRTMSAIENERFRLEKDIGARTIRTFDIVSNSSDSPNDGVAWSLQTIANQGFNQLVPFEFLDTTNKTSWDTYRNYAKDFVLKNYQNIQYVEPENEPAAPHFDNNINNYINFQKAIIKGVHEAEAITGKNIKVISNAFFGWQNYSNGQPLPDALFEGVDAMSYHYYTESFNTLESYISSSILYYRQLLPTKYKDLPLWQSEGQTTGSELYDQWRLEISNNGVSYRWLLPSGKIAAYRQIKKFILEAEMGVKKNFLFHMWNVTDDRYFADWSMPRPMLPAVNAITRVMDNYTPYRVYNDSNDQMYMAIFKHKNQNKYLMTFWQKFSQPNQKFDLLKNIGSFQSIDFMGNDFTPQTNGASWSYDLSSSPQYVYFTGNINTLTQELEKTLTRKTDFNQTTKVNSVNYQPTSPSVNQSIQFSSQVNNSDDDTLTYAWDFGDQQTSTEQNPSHTYTQAGTYTISLAVSDGIASDQKTATVDVLSGSSNNPPVLDPIGDQSVEVDTNLKFTISATDQDKGDKLTYSATNLPTGATFNPNSQKFDWTPTSSDVGAHSGIVFYVSGGIDSSSEIISITVSSSTITPPTNNPPVLDPIGDQSVEVDTNLKFTISATDKDKGDKLTYSATNLPTGATFNPNSQKFDWTPTSTDVGTHSGIVFSVSDGADSSSETISITVNNPIGGGDETIYPPTNLQVFENGNNVHLKWDDDKNSKGTIDHYNIYRRINQQTVTNIDTAKSTNYVDKTAPDSSYIQYAVQAVSKLGTTSALSASADITLSDLTPPTAPTNLQVSIENNNTNKPKVTLTGDASTDNTTAKDKIRYLLYRSVNGVDLKEINNAFKTSIEDTSVKNQSAVYSYYVLAQDKNKLFSAPSNTVNIQVQLDENNPIGGSKDITEITTKPKPPQNLQLNPRYSKDSQAYHIDISWEHSPSTNLKSYKIYRDDIEVDSVTANRTSLLDASPPPGTSTYTIKSIDDQNIISDPSNEVTVNVPEVLKVTTLHMNEITTNKAEISLTTNIPSEVHIKYGKLSWLRVYQYVRGKLQKSYTPQINLNKNQSDDDIILDHTITLPNLSRNNFYYYQIEVTNPANTLETITLPQESFKTPMFGWWR